MAILMNHPPKPTATHQLRVNVQRPGIRHDGPLCKIFLSLSTSTVTPCPGFRLKQNLLKSNPSQSPQVFSPHQETKKTRLMFGKSLVARNFFALDMFKLRLRKTPRTLSAKSSRNQNLKTVRIAPTIVTSDIDDQR